MQYAVVLIISSIFSFFFSTKLQVLDNKESFSFTAQLALGLFGFYLAAISLIAFEKGIFETEDLEIVLITYRIVRIMNRAMLWALIMIIFSAIGLIMEIKPSTNWILAAFWIDIILTTLLLMAITVVLFFVFAQQAILENYLRIYEERRAEIQKTKEKQADFSGIKDEY